MNRKEKAQARMEARIMKSVKESGIHRLPLLITEADAKKLFELRQALAAQEVLESPFASLNSTIRAAIRIAHGQNCNAEGVR